MLPNAFAFSHSAHPSVIAPLSRSQKRQVSDGFCVVSFAAFSQSNQQIGLNDSFWGIEFCVDIQCLFVEYQGFVEKRSGSSRFPLFQ